MDFETTLTVVIVLAIPTFIFVLAKLILMARQEGIEQIELESGVYELDREPAEIIFGDDESGKRPSTSSDETRRSYEDGAGDNQTDGPDFTEEVLPQREPAATE